LVTQNVRRGGKFKEIKNQVINLRKNKHNIYAHKDLGIKGFSNHSIASQQQNKKPDDDSGVVFKATKELQGHFGKIYAMHWGPDSVHLASASQDGKLMIWDGTTTNKRHMINLRSSWVMTCAYGTGGEYVACGGLDNLCSIYKIDFTQAETHERPKAELSRHDGYLSCCRFVDSFKILTSSGDGTILLWDINNNQTIKSFRSHNADVMSIALFGDDDTTFVSGSCDGTSKVWDSRVGNEKELYTFVGHESDINTVQWFPERRSFASGSDDSHVRLYDLRAYAEIERYTDEKIACGVTYIDFSKTGKYLFAGYDDKPYAVVWQTLERNALQSLQHTNRVSCLGVPKTGYCLCTGAWDNNLFIWTASRK